MQILGEKEVIAEIEKMEQVENTSAGARVMRVGSKIYLPSRQAWEFHNAKARFRYVICGVKSGKSKMGAVELARCALDLPNGLSWVVAPTYLHLQVAERELMAVFSEFDGIVLRRNRAHHEILLANGHVIQARSADWENNLRGPNIDGAIWIDEGGYLSNDAWEVVRSRVSAAGGEIFVTTTPNGRNWVWGEVQSAGMPSDAPYGFFSCGDRWVMHHPTWSFPWVPADEIEALRTTLSKQKFEQDIAANFIADTSRVFHNIEGNVSWEPPPEKFNGATSIGVDLAKFQDWTSVVVMRPDGFVPHVDRWHRVDWSVQKPRLVELAKNWNGVIVLDRSNVGSVIEEDLRDAGVTVLPIDMNSPQIRQEVIQGLMIAFEQGRLKLPARKAPWAPTMTPQLYNELDWFEYKLTPGGRLTYSAPRGLTDDMVIALALANWGRFRGVAGGVEAAEVMVKRDDHVSSMVRMNREGGIRLTRPKAWSSIYSKRRTSLGFQGSDFMWRQ